MAALFSSDQLPRASRQYAIVTVVMVCSIVSCMTPQKVYDKGNYRKAIKMAMSDINKGKEVVANRAIIMRAAREIANKRVDQHPQVMAGDVRDWKKYQAQYYRDLQLVGRVYKHGVADVLPAYDAICDRKMELDYAIIAYYYDGADSLLNVAYNTGHKASARMAYRYLQDCLDASGDSYYSDISQLMDEAVDLGTVYFVADGLSPRTSLFIQPLPHDTDLVPDCRVSVSIGFMDSDVTTTTDTKIYTDEVVSRKETYRDTAGVVHTRSIIEEISATVEITTYQIVVEQRVDIDVQRLTDHCSMSSDWETITRSETVEEVSITGDRAALPRGYPTSSVHILQEVSQLESDVRSAVYRWIDSY